MKTIKFLILISFITSISFPQTGEDKVILSGNLSADSKIILNNYTEPVTSQFMYSQENKKSPILAGVMSMIIREIIKQLNFRITRMIIQILIITGM